MRHVRTAETFTIRLPAKGAALVRRVDNAKRKGERSADESEIAGHRREGRRQTRTNCGHGADDDHRNKGRDQAVLDRRSATLVFDEASECRHLNCSDFLRRYSPANARMRR